MKLRINLIAIALLAFAGNVIGQKSARIQPGRLYQPGETLYAPRFGFTAKVPEGWEGMLPRESEVFLLTTTTSTYGEIYVFGREQGELNSMRNVWSKGFDLSESIKLKASNPEIKDGMLTSEVIAEGEYINKGFKGFAIARCNPVGPCITTLMIAPVQFYDAVKKTVTQFMTGSSFSPPSTASPYADLDWKEFLSNKVLVTYAAVQDGSKETKVDLCANGTFTANVKKSGILRNDNPLYKGNMSGAWEVEGTGEQTTIRFTFQKKNLQPLEARLLIKDEKVYSGDERYFVGKSDKCR